MYSSKNDDNQTPSPTSKQVPYDPATRAPVSSYDKGSTEINSTGAPLWSTGLCDCMDDPATCCMTCWCPCITFGRIAEIVDQGSTSCLASGTIYTLLHFVTGCWWIYPCGYRSRMRYQYKLPRSPCPDCLVHLCCNRCALCQEYRELQHRGFDMSVGWEENMAGQNRGVEMPHMAPAGMSR
ncbi:hypothetical protein LguiA_030755 [Lonicera macranthoides]